MYGTLVDGTNLSPTRQMVIIWRRKKRSVPYDCTEKDVKKRWRLKNNNKNGPFGMYKALDQHAGRSRSNHQMRNKWWRLPYFKPARSKALGTSFVFHAPIGVMRPRIIDNGSNLSPTRPMFFFVFWADPRSTGSVIVSINWQCMVHLLTGRICPRPVKWL